jgi:hypothetical protein
MCCPTSSHAFVNSRKRSLLRHCFAATVFYVRRRETESDRESKPTSQLDPAALGVLLEDVERVLGERPNRHPIGSDEIAQVGQVEPAAAKREERPTQTIHRDELLGLIDQATPPPEIQPHARTVSRDQLRARHEIETSAIAPLQPVSRAGMDDSILEVDVQSDFDVRKRVSPLVWLSILAVAAFVYFIIALQLR